MRDEASARAAVGNVIFAEDWREARERIRADPWLVTDEAQEVLSRTVGFIESHEHGARHAAATRFVAAVLARVRGEGADAALDQLVGWDPILREIATPLTFAKVRALIADHPELLEGEGPDAVNLACVRASNSGSSPLGESLFTLSSILEGYRHGGVAYLDQREARYVAEALRSVEPQNADTATRAACERAIALLSGTPADPVRLELLAGLGSYLLESREGSPVENVARAQAAYREVLSVAEGAGLQHERLIGVMGLANALSRDFAGSAGVAEEAARWYHEAISECRRDPSLVEERASSLMNFAQFLIRSQLGDRWENVERARVLLLESVALLEPVAQGRVHPAYGRALHNLGTAYLARLDGVPSQNVDDAITVLLRALEHRPATRDPIGRARTLRTLARAYPEWSGADSLSHGRQLSRQAFDEAQALDGRPSALATSGRDLERNRSALWVDHDELAAEEGSTMTLRGILAWHEHLLATIPRERMPLVWAEWKGGIGYLHRLLTLPGHGGAAAPAYESLRDALGAPGIRGQPRLHRKLQQRLGDLCHALGDWEGALSAYGASVDIGIETLTASGTSPSQHVEILDTSADALFAAYAAARLGKTEEAVRFAELQRGRLLIDEVTAREVLLGDVPEAVRADVGERWGRVVELETELRRARYVGATGVQAEALHRMADALGVAPSYMGVRVTAGDRSGDRVAAEATLATSEALRVARRELRDAVGRARLHRANPGALGWEDVQSVAADVGRPIVYLVATMHGALALGVPTEGRPEVIPLPRMTSVRSRWLALEAEGVGYVAASAQRKRNHLGAVLAVCGSELLEHVAAPVAEWLRGREANGATLIPLGSLGLLPLHWAMLETGLVPSVAPSARVLRLALGARNASREPLLTVVSDPEADGLVELPFARAECAHAAAWFAKLGPVRPLSNRQATKQAVVDALQKSSHVHLACHGTFRPSDPMASMLHLAGGDELAVRELAVCSGDGRVGLVFLSACQSAVVESRLMPDEVIGFPSALLTQGASTVVATSWKVDDLATALLCAQFYERLFEHNRTARTPAEALAGAQWWIRDAHPAALREAVVELRRTVSQNDGRVLALLDDVMSEIGELPPSATPFSDPEYWAGFTHAGV